MKEKIKIAIVDDSDVYREFLVNYFKLFDDFEIIIVASNGRELIKAIRKQKPDVVLLDLKMPVMDGKETAEYLFKYHPEIKILILTMYNDENLSHDLLEKGVSVFLLKNNDVAQVADAIYALFKYEHYFAGWSVKKIVSDKSSKKNTSFTNDKNLSDRELEILKLLCEENTNQEIADKLHISKRTIDGHRNTILEKVNARNVVGLVKFAFHHGLISLK